MVYADIKEKVEKYETRVRVVDVTFEVDPTEPSKLSPVVEVEILE